MKGLWGFEQLDRTGLSSLKLVILLTLAADLIGWALSLVVGSVDPGSILAPYYTERVTQFTIIGVSGVLGLTVALNIVLARTTEADLRNLSLEECVALLKPRATIFLPITLVIVVLTTFISPVLASLRLNVSLSEMLVAFYESGTPLRVMFFVLWPVAGLMWGIGFAIGVTQIMSLIKAARTIPIDLFRLPVYSTLASPTIRVIVIVLGMMSIFPLFMFLVDDPVVDEQVVRLMIVMVLVVSPALVAWCFPVLIVRNRIRSKKAEELDTLLLAIEGDEGALTRSCIPKRGNSVSTADLLTHQMFIESRWEWPIGAHVQKLIMFGLLPPTTWILAALVENYFF